MARARGFRGYLAEERDKVLRKWRRDEVSLVDGAAELIRIGFTSEQAWSLLERT